ncbi:hypothetical protein LCGC14_0886130 [marine sediment metagenome]|uniref:Uncharacterized protein n=1 Tax=marine sediment metagenome TaxID=412755 RepID=A0A0F9S7I9_9ZZZZ
MESVLDQIKMAYINNLYGCFYKPINLEEIKSIIRKILRKNLEIAERGTQNDN